MCAPPESDRASVTGINKTTNAATLTYDPWGGVREVEREAISTYQETVGGRTQSPDVRIYGYARSKYSVRYSLRRGPFMSCIVYELQLSLFVKSTYKVTREYLSLSPVPQVCRPLVSPCRALHRIRRPAPIRFVCFGPVKCAAPRLHRTLLCDRTRSTTPQLGPYSAPPASALP